MGQLEKFGDGFTFENHDVIIFGTLAENSGTEH
jgi:hypothetical protein